MSTARFPLHIWSFVLYLYVFVSNRNSQCGDGDEGRFELFLSLSFFLYLTPLRCARAVNLLFHDRSEASRGTRTSAKRPFIKKRLI